MAKKIVFIHLFFGVIALSIYHYHLEGPDLVWNMFLALVALDFSLVSYAIYKYSIVEQNEFDFVYAICV